MSKPDANFGGGKKIKVYHLIQELIQEGKCAWFVNRKGRFRIKWEIAVERYIEYRAKKNPKCDLRNDRRKASNSFREALLHRYCDGADGAKEYKDCRKIGEKNKIVEREFQMPSKVFHSLFGSSEELPSDQSATSGISVSDPESTQDDQSLMQLLEDLDCETLDNFTEDYHSALEEISTNSDNDMDQSGVVQDICSSSGSVEADGNPQVSPDVGTSPDASDTGFEELMDVSDDLLTMNATGTALQGNINRDDNVDPSNIESPSQIIGIKSIEDFHSALEEISTDSVVQGICPLSGSVKGGIQFLVVLKEALLESDTKGVARFERVGDASLEKTSPHTFSGFIPAAQEAGRVLVTVYTEAGRKLGVTYFTYVDEVRQALKQLIKDPAQISLFLTMWSQEHGIIGSSSDVAQTPGSLPDAKQVQCLKVLQLLIYTAAQVGAQQFLEVIFSTSAGKIVFNSYKDRTPQPEDVARANGHDESMEFLQDVNKRLSKESDSNSVTLSTSEWLELVQAVDNIQKQTVSNDEEESSRMQPKDDDNQSDYFADAETSSSGSHDLVGDWSDLQVENVEHRLADVDTSSCGSFEVDSDRSDSEGSFTKDIKPTEKESLSLNPPVEPSSEETTQFDQAEVEEKTNFGSSRFHMFNPLSRRVGGPGSNDTHHCVLSWGTFLMCAVILPRLLAGFIVKGFLFFIGVVMGLLKKSRLVCAHFCLAVGGTLIYSNSLRSFISGFQSSIECKRYRMVFNNCCLVVILACNMITVGSILSGFQSSPLIMKFWSVCTFICIAVGGIQLVYLVGSILSGRQLWLGKIRIRNPIQGGFQSSIECKRYRMVSNDLFLALILACTLMISVRSILSELNSIQSFTDVKVHPKFDMNHTLDVGVMLALCIVLLICKLGEDLSVLVAEAELKKKTENKTKEDSLICPLNYIPPQGNAPKKRKENRVFYSPESYTSFQKCSASIY